MSVYICICVCMYIDEVTQGKDNDLTPLQLI